MRVAPLAAASFTPAIALARFAAGSAVIRICTRPTEYFVGAAVMGENSTNSGAGPLLRRPARTPLLAHEHRLQLLRRLRLLPAVALTRVVAQNHFLVGDLHDVFRQERSEERR